MKPALCIVSGDLVYVVPAGSSTFAIELTRQYDQAKELLVEIADELFEGDRQRVVIVPGNHDISFNHVLEARTSNIWD